MLYGVTISIEMKIGDINAQGDFLMKVFLSVNVLSEETSERFFSQTEFSEVK
jgi:hypothetical protein